jgi:Ohr subfamily peroxiredoxin
MTTLYTAHVRSVGGREGHVRSSDGALDLDTRKPVESGGPGGGVNPEQLFAAAYSACYGGSIAYVADKQGISLPDGWAVDAAVSMNLEGNGVFLSVEMQVSLPGMEHEKAERLARTAYNACPYSKAIKGNVNVDLKVTV